MSDVQNPIIIDQNYCPNDQNCPHQGSGVKISNIKYQDIHGTSATEVAMTFDCSKTQPCNGITLDDVNLTYKNHPAQASCSNAGGTSSGLVKPASCLYLKANCSPLRSISVVSYGHSANNSQSPMVVSTIRDLYERAEAKMQVPIEFEQLRNKSMVFRINLKNEHIRNPAKPISVLSESESGDEAISPIVQANLKLKGVANDQDEVDTGAIKRCLLDQFSSSQNLKKCRPLVIKEEKTL
nr:polygalacturonase-like [Ipomoea batatas]